MSYFLGVLAVVLFIIIPMAHLGLLERFLVDIAFSFMLISGAIATHRSHFLTALIIALTLAGLIVDWLTMYLPSFRHPLLDAFFALACFASFVIVLMLQVFRPGLITLHRVLGAVAAYISIGITWGYAYYATSLVNPGAVRFESPSQAYDIPSARYIYFSFTTLTTVGYGDVVPVHPVTRALAVAEALIGQLYPAILIAGVLGLALQTRFREEK
jgi:Ion channel